ncbi:hypothetical protein RQP46_007956 [Phenoliferia psychrophenolica]
MSDTDSAADAAKSKLIGTVIALVATIFEGGSYIVSKKGLQRTALASGQPSSASHAYLKSPVWWVGTGMNGIAQGLNFVALMFASPVLVAPLGALSVVNGAVFARIFLGERLSRHAVYACTLCIAGAMVIFLSAPAQIELTSIDDAVAHVLAPGFLAYIAFIVSYIFINLTFIAPRWGTKTPLVYVSICSFVGSLTVTSVACFGVGAASGEFNRLPTWLFLLSVIVCILTQLNFFNKALDLFPTTTINATTYVGFACLTIVASAILLGGFQSSSNAQIATLIAGLYITCLAIIMLSEAPIGVKAEYIVPDAVEEGEISEGEVLLSGPPLHSGTDSPIPTRVESFDLSDEDEESRMLGGNYKR